MADYSTIKGFSVETLASDPYATAEGAGTWASGGNTNLARRSGVGMGTQTAGMIAGGESTPAPSGYAETETYDGTSWTEVNNLNHARKFLSGGAGTSSSGVIAGGSVGPGAGTPMDYGETWDGTSWTEEGTLNTAGRGVTLAGASSTSAMVAGRAPGTANLVEEWNGSTWTEVNDMIGTARYSMGRSGTVTSALFFTGDPLSKESESYDGTSWTTAPTTNYGAYGAGSAGANSSQGVLFGGSMPGSPEGQYANTTETYDGTAWAIQADMALTVADRMGCGTLTSALAIGGYDAGGNTLGSEEWSVPSTVTVAQEGQVWYNSSSDVLKGFAQAGTGAWASGGDVNTARTQCGSAGTQTAALLFLGESPYADKNRTEEYDGTTWTETNNANTARQAVAISIGTQTTAIAAGGTPGGALNEQYDGSCWAEGNDLSSSRYSRGGAGTSTAGMAWGGTTGPSGPGAQATNETWNGTSWSEVNNINTARFKCNGAGTQTAAITAGGQAPAFQDITESWDGTSWTEVGDMNAVNTEYSSANAGTSTAWGVFGGARPAVSAACEEWNGTSWSAVASMATARQAVGGGGTTLAGLVSCSNAPLTTACEEFTVPNAIKTFTSS